MATQVGCVMRRRRAGALADDLAACGGFNGPEPLLDRACVPNRPGLSWLPWSAAPSARSRTCQLEVKVIVRRGTPCYSAWSARLASAVGPAWAEHAAIVEPRSWPNASWDRLLLDGVASLSTVQALRDGRTRHGEMWSLDALSQHWAHVGALAGAPAHLLVLEVGALPRPQLGPALGALVSSGADFDVAVISPLALFARPTQRTGLEQFDPWNLNHALPASALLEPFNGSAADAAAEFGRLRPNASFLGTRALFYSPRGRQKLVRLIGSRAAEMAFDATLAALSAVGELSVVVSAPHGGQRVDELVELSAGQREEEAWRAARCVTCNMHPN